MSGRKRLSCEHRYNRSRREPCEKKPRRSGAKALPTSPTPNCSFAAGEEKPPAGGSRPGRSVDRVRVGWETRRARSLGRLGYRAVNGRIREDPGTGGVPGSVITRWGLGGVSGARDAHPVALTTPQCCPRSPRKEKAPAGAGRPAQAAWNSQLKSRRSVLTSIRKDARGLVPTSRVHALN